MGVLQQGVNQALTGATFLLQQTPWWQGMAHRKEDIKKIKGLMNVEDSSDATAGQLARDSIEASGRAKKDMANDKDASLRYDIAEHRLSKSKYWSSMAHGAHEEIGKIISKDPKLMKKFAEDYNIPLNSNVGKLQEIAMNRIKELHDQYKKQKANQDSFKEELKISKKDADVLRSYGIPEDKIKEARYN